MSYAARNSLRSLRYASQKTREEQQQQQIHTPPKTIDATDTNTAV